jgi:hypothetical protein
MPSTAVRWGVVGALLAAAALTFAGVVALLSPYPEGSTAWLLVASSEAIAGAAVLVALVALHVLQGSRSGWLGRAGTWIAGAGSALMTVTTVMWLLPLTDGLLLDVLFYGAVLGWLVGFPLVGAGAVRAQVLPRWCAVLLGAYSPLFAAVFLLIDGFGGVRAILALPWLAVAYALWSLALDAAEGRTSRQPARAS